MVRVTAAGAAGARAGAASLSVVIPTERVFRATEESAVDRRIRHGFSHAVSPRLGSIAWQLAARLKSYPSRSWRCQDSQRDRAVESHVSQKKRDMGHPWVVVAWGEQQVPHRASAIRNDKGLMTLC